MKFKLFLLSFLFLSLFSKAQFPNQTPQGNALTEVYYRGGAGVDSALHFRTSFADTIAANRGFLKNIPGLVIRVKDTLFLRNNTATKWINYASNVQRFAIEDNTGIQNRYNNFQNYGLKLDSLGYLFLNAGDRTFAGVASSILLTNGQSVLLSQNSTHSYSTVQAKQDSAALFGASPTDSSAFIVSPLGYTFVTGDDRFKNSDPAKFLSTDANGNIIIATGVNQNIMNSNLTLDQNRSQNLNDFTQILADAKKGLILSNDGSSLYSDYPQDSDSLIDTRINLEWQNGASVVYRKENIISLSDTTLKWILDSTGIYSVATNTGSQGGGRIDYYDTALKIFYDGTLRMHGVNYNWPASQGAANTVLTNNGSGGLSWNNAFGGYVPYTGATSDVDLGSQNLTTGGYLQGDLWSLSPTNFRFRNDAGNVLVSFNGVSGFAEAFDVSGITTGRTVTFPDADINISTVGKNFMSLTNPSAITFPRINAGNTVDALSASAFRTAIGAGTGSGTLTALTGDVTASGTGSVAATLATVNSNVGSFGSATQTGTFTVNGKGLITAASNVTITPAVGSITGLGIGVATALGINTSSAGGLVLFNGAGGTPSSLALTNATGLLVAGGGTGIATTTAYGTITGGTTATSAFQNAGTGTTGQVLTSNGNAALPTWQTPTTGTVTSVSGTTNRITSTGGTTPVIDISATFEALLGKVANPLSQFASTTSAQLRGVLSDENGSGVALFDNSTSATFITPALGTPSALVGTNITGIASGLTAGNVTTNANLTGAITSVGNASSLGSFSSANLLGALTDETGTGVAVFGTTPTIATPVINGLATGTGVASAATASTIVTRDANANINVNNTNFGYTTTATAAGTTTLTVGSTMLQYFTGSTTQTVVLPVASTLVLGQRYIVVNNSSGVVTINSSGGNAVMVLAASSASTITCILTSGTDATSWNTTIGLISSVSNADGTLTISPTTGAVVASINLAGSNIWSANTTFVRNTTTSTLSALTLRPTNASTVGTPVRWSPSTVYRTRVWNTGGTPANNDDDFTIEAVGTSGNPTSAVLNFSYALNGAANTIGMQLTSAGNLVVGAANNITGTATNNSAAAGNVGEEINSTISTYTNYTTTATYQNITSIALTAGDWDISAFGTLSSNAATITLAANAIFVISTTTASAAGATEGQNIAYIPQAALVGTSKESLGITPYRISLSGNTTYYLNTQATFTIGNPQYVGSIRARRIR